ncbi:helix-turn-helix domain-containing protein [Streptomyces sp. NPDC026672]|uniref:TetR/AcrR family transcriptional regulator n=1 Tax=unclassified Streptomyces TaxID=2593676 RepID=UPI00340185CE
MTPPPHPGRDLRDSEQPDRERPLRRDAERNRQRIIEAAREVFAAHGVSAGLNDIARHAGVGVGTVYRRFPDKEELVRVALEEHLTSLVALVDEGLAAADPWEGFSHVVRRAVEMNVADRGLRDVAFSSAPGRRQVDALREGIVPGMGELLRRAQRDGSARPDVTVTDLIMLMLMITEFAQRSAPVRPEAFRRYLELVIGSLRALPEGRADDLPVTVGAEDARAIAEHWSHRPR